MPAVRFSNNEATITTLCCFATFASDSVEGPGIVSASLKRAVSSVWQKYWERKSSCKQITCAPFFAASAMRPTAFLKFASGRSPQLIWISPTRTVFEFFFFGMAESIERRDCRLPIGSRADVGLWFLVFGLCLRRGLLRYAVISTLRSQHQRFKTKDQRPASAIGNWQC